MDFGNVAGVSDIHAASIFEVEDGGSIYFQNVNTAQIHTV